MSLSKIARKKTIFTIIIAAVLISAALAGGNWKSGFAETIPTLSYIVPDTVHVNSAGFTATIYGGDFVGMLYTKVFFREPNGTVHEFLPASVFDCASEYHCSTLTVEFPYSLFSNQGIADIWVVNYDEFGNETGTSLENLNISIVDELYLPIIMKNG